ncbi:diadenylate cyclase [Haloferula luteola]|uniref:Diadenylate cyclase n=1 Tax=Haloferula luteola TaxID=595692 RepID=A0A840V674_9BACT|nr:diadenylate cyclase CdaA [Haloferula luteola]MBB5353525.1 diadenylate cyclase [Haloferula luteola]
MLWDFVSQHWRHAIEILVLTFLIYQVYRAFRATRGARILVGLVVILVVFTGLLQLFKFQVITWLVTKALFVLLVALPVIFQPEIRTALARVGSSRWLDWLLRNERRQVAFLGILGEAVVSLSKKRVGALFAIERNISLKPQQDTGVTINAIFSPELAQSLFYPKSPLHDGALILAEERIQAAACVLPVSQKELSDRSIGLRHRAAIGLTEETDSVCVVVSEETGAISICMDGQIERGLSVEKFQERMEEIFLGKSKEHEKGVSQESGSEADLADSGDRDLDGDPGATDR